MQRISKKGTVYNEGSEKGFPAYADKPPLCCFCGKRVRLKDWSGCYWDEEKKRGRVWHLGCDPLRVSVMVESL